MSYIGVISACVGVIFLIVALVLARQNRVFRDALRLMGTVTGKRHYETEYDREHPSRQREVYKITFFYTVDGNNYETEIEVTDADYEAGAIGSSLEILCRADKPKKILRPADTDPQNIKIVLIVGTALTAVGIVLFLIGKM